MNIVNPFEIILILNTNLNETASFKYAKSTSFRNQTLDSVHFSRCVHASNRALIFHFSTGKIADDKQARGKL